MKNFILILLSVLTFGLTAQTDKTPLLESDIKFINGVFANIAVSDQIYRTSLQYGTTDKSIHARIDSIGEADGMKAAIDYYTGLNLKLPKSTEDSLRNAQLILDFTNHMTLRGIWERYGWISKEDAPDHAYVQELTLLHPPYDKEYIQDYLDEYTSFLILEVEEGRMPAKLYAMFYDNMKGKILRQPQLYGTNQQYDMETKTILPPGIKDILATNRARKKLGLPELKEGEYRIIVE